MIAIDKVHFEAFHPLDIPLRETKHFWCPWQVILQRVLFIFQSNNHLLVAKAIQKKYNTIGDGLRYCYKKS